VTLRGLAACALATACGPPGASTPAPAPDSYLNDAAFRRSELVRSLVNAGNGYSKLRLEHYATGSDGDWERLPEWNPGASPVTVDELAQTASAPAPSDERALTLPDGVTDEDDSRLVALGRTAFERYPVQLTPYLGLALRSNASASDYGLWVDPERGVGGLVHARMADGSTSLAMTCSTCHAAETAAGIENGAPNAELDLGKAQSDASSAPFDPSSPIPSWGPGRLDVTTTAGTEPVQIADLRPVGFLGYLHKDATVAVLDRTALAIRIETLLVTSYGQVLRPPRVVALALAAYVASLADTLPALPSAEEASPRGARVFAETCASCHVPPALTGPPVPLAVVGTDPVIGLSADRGTGTYRVPSLHGVSTRGPLLHDGTVPSLAAFLDPARVTAGFTERLHGEGPVPGHPFGLDLPDADRAALETYLEAL
jgi:mono/diheme cytochrome c family protein